MYVCQRCVSVLLSRPLSAALQHSTRALHQRAHPSLLQHSTGHSRQTWRHYTDYQAVSPDVNNKIDLVKKNVVPLNSDVHRIDLDAAVHPSPLQEISEEEAVQIQVPSTLPPESSTLRPYVDKSETLSKLVQLGVNLWKLEQKPNVGSMLVRLDFHADVAPKLLFLKDLGVEESELGQLLTKNPFILTESLDNLEVRSERLYIYIRAVHVSKAGSVIGGKKLVNIAFHIADESHSLMNSISRSLSVSYSSVY